VNQINAARTESYQKLADSNNLPVDEVAKMAGQKAGCRAQPGEYVKGIGKWLKVVSGSAYDTFARRHAKTLLKRR
jgi:uncharacterized protein YdbL (DUF1318 family)